MKSIGNIAKYTLLALWLISVALAISIGVNSAFAADGRVVQKKVLCCYQQIRYKLNSNTMIIMQRTLMIDDFKIARSKRYRGNVF
jgi:hypothetical protein